MTSSSPCRLAALLLAGIPTLLRCSKAAGVIAIPKAHCLLHCCGSRVLQPVCEAAHGQFSSEDPTSLPLTDFGVDHDPELFYANQPRLLDQSSWLSRAKWSIAARLVNRRTQQLRMHQQAELVNARSIRQALNKSPAACDQPASGGLRRQISCK